MYQTTITTSRAANGLHRLAHVHASRAVRLHCSVHRTAWQKRAAERLTRYPSSLSSLLRARVAENLLASAHARLAAYSTRLLREREAVSFQGERLMSAPELTAALSTLWSFGSHDVR